ncbi:hypothetical protein HDU79_004122 [Rhizoclosmatium sp. JEL0117]|nr:hypothetical protein HDU79_004122 [Rhizoclosmatium sp. JEL0117]
MWGDAEDTLPRALEIQTKAGLGTSLGVLGVLAEEDKEEQELDDLDPEAPPPPTSTTTNIDPTSPTTLSPLSPVEMMLGSASDIVPLRGDGDGSNGTDADPLLNQLNYQSNHPHPPKRRGSTVSSTFVDLDSSLPASDSKERDKDKGKRVSHRLSTASIDFTSFRRGVTAKSSRVSMSIQGISQNVQETVQEALKSSSSWVHPLRNWSRVDSNAFAFVPASQESVNAIQPYATPQMSFAVSESKQSSDSSLTNESVVMAPPTPAAAIRRGASKSILKANSFSAIHPQQQQQQLQMDHQLFTKQLQQPQIEKPKPAPNPSIIPCLSATCCPCIIYSQNRQLFLRSGGSIENDPISSFCGGSSTSTSSASESSKIAQAACCFVLSIPICMYWWPLRSLRRAIRTRYALTSDDADGESNGECGEWMLSLCCCCIPCALVQERQEILHWEHVVKDTRDTRDRNRIRRISGIM